MPTVAQKMIESLVSGLSTNQDTNVLRDYQTPEGIVKFVVDVIRAKPTDYQAEILHDFVLHKRMCVRAPHGVGKTALSSWVVLWGMAVFEDDTKIITTASAWRQLKNFTWPEIHLWAGKALWSKIGLSVVRKKNLLDLSMTLPGNKQAFAIASDNPAFIEGAHATKIIYVFDEAKAIPAPTWDASEGAFSNAGDDTNATAYALAISTPGETSGRFYSIQNRSKGYEDWRVRHVTLDEAIKAGRISKDWVKARAKQWGENSAIYRNRVLGEFSDSGEDTVIPLSWVEKSNERWYEKNGKGVGKTVYGVDPAYKGEDNTCIAKQVGNVVEHIESHHREDTMQTAGRIASMALNHAIAVDVIGVGAGVHDRLRELSFNSIAVNVSEKTAITCATAPVGFVNLRSALWWLIREALDPNGTVLLALPPNDILTGDLTAPKWWYESTGRVRVESKDDIRARLGRSPDHADAVCLAYYCYFIGARRLIMM